MLKKTLVLLAVAALTTVNAGVNINNLQTMAQESASMYHEVDEILNSAKSEVSSVMSAAAPKTAVEEPQHMGVFIEESALAKGEPVALVEAADGSAVDAAPATPGGATTMDNRIQSIVGAKVVLKGPKFQQAEENLSSGVVPAMDPDTQKMIETFNQKYGVYDSFDVNNKAAESYIPKDLMKDEKKPEVHEGLDSDIVRDYKSVYAGANKWHFDPNLDNPTSLDQMLGSMWAKRWEYFSDQRKKEVSRASKTIVHRITPAFNEMYVEPTHDSSIGKIYTYANDKDANLVKSIPNRTDFAPKNYWYGPKVIDTALDVTGNKNGHGGSPSSPPSPGVKSFVYAQYRDGKPGQNGPVYIESIQVTDRKNSDQEGVGKIEKLTTPTMVAPGAKLSNPRRAFVRRQRPKQ